MIRRPQHSGHLLIPSPRSPLHQQAGKVSGVFQAGPFPSPHTVQSMFSKPTNPYVVEGHGLFDASKGEFVVENGQINCGQLLMLPKVCLQTCETEGLVEFGSIIFARPIWLGKVQVATGAIAAVLVAMNFLLIFQLDFAVLNPWYGRVLMFGPCCLMLMALSPWVLFQPTIHVKGYLLKHRRRTWLTAGLFSAVTSLPFLIVFFGFVTRSAPWSISQLFSTESWWPIVMLVAAIGAGRLLRRLLEWHWRTTRTRGLVFKATLIGNGLFAVSGFTSEFLAALNHSSPLDPVDPDGSSDFL
jgi:hypothetical protein